MLDMTLAKAEGKERPTEATLPACFCSIADEDYERKARPSAQKTCLNSPLKYFSKHILLKIFVHKKMYICT